MSVCPVVRPVRHRTPFDPSSLNILYNNVRVNFSLATDSGMESSVKVSAAVMENLLLGSVCSYKPQLLMILKFVYVKMKAQTMKTLQLG